MVVKWKGLLSKVKDLPGSGAMGATIGLLEYIAQSNNNTDGLKENEKYKWIDDLTALEKIELSKIGLSSYNIKKHIPNDIPTDNGFIEAKALRSQKTIEEIENWTKNQKMMLNRKKSNVMIFNFSKDKKFTTRIKMEGENLPVVNKTKILGTILTNDLKWEENTKDLVKRANFRLLMLRKATKFTENRDDLKDIYNSYIRSILEQSSVIWGKSLTYDNILDLERVQKNVLRIILKEEYNGYDEGLKLLNMEKLSERREKLLEKFALGCLTNKKTKMLFPLRKKKHIMKTRNKGNFMTVKAKTERWKRSTVPEIQKLLNKKDIII